MKFIHTADLHLDSPFQGLQNDSLPEQLWQRIRQSTFQSFERIVNEAINQQVDFVLLVGDLFDRNEQSVAATAFLTEQLNRLRDHQIDAFISFGNHDYATIDSPHLGYPDNTHIFSNQVETKRITLTDGTVVAISGFSFPNQWVKQPMIQDYPEAVANADWHIGMLHGSLDSLKSSEANYAPFTLQALKSKRYDYWALGHIHKRQSLDDQGVINYSGNIQGRQINESGEKGYLLIQSNGHQLRTTFEPTAPIIWQRLKMSTNQVLLNDLTGKILEYLSKQHFSQLHFVRVQIDAKQSLNREVIAAISNGDLLESVQQQNAMSWQQLNCWVTSIQLLPSKHIVAHQFDQELFDQAKGQTLTIPQLSNLAKVFNQYPFIKEDLASKASQKDVFDQTTLIMAENIQNVNEDGVDQ